MNLDAHKGNHCRVCYNLYIFILISLEEFSYAYMFSLQV